MKLYNRKTVYDDLTKYDYLAKEHNFIEISEWENGEGWDINFNETQIQLTHGQLEAINYLTKVLDVEELNQKT